MVMGNFVLAHFVKVETALFDVKRVLRPGGRVGFTAWSDGKDAYEDAWLELVESVVPREMLQPAYSAAAPGHDRFKQPSAIEDTPREAGFRNVRTERKRYQWTRPRGPGRGPRHVDRRPVRPQHARRGGWASLMERTRATFADRFPDPLNDFRDVIVAVAAPLAEVEHAELLRVLHADLLPGLDGLLAEHLLEEPDPLGELALVLRERLDHRREVPRGVLDVVRLVRPAEPDVVDVLNREALPEVLGKKCGFPLPGNDASSATKPAVRWSEWL